MATTAAPRRRWFKFSLRSLFVLLTATAILASWANYSLRWIERRAEFRRRPEVGILHNRHNPDYNRFSGPGGMWLFGEEGYQLIIVKSPEYSVEDLWPIHRLYPEADILVRTANGDLYRTAKGDFQPR